jgi:putative transposase
MWGTDLTTTFTGEGPAAVFIAVDHCSAECVGVHAHARATRFEALEPIRQGVRRSLRWLRGQHRERPQGAARLCFRPRPGGNGCAERFIRTLEENLLCVRHFETIEELRQALLAFRETYNETWLIERHGYLTPSQFRQRQLQPVADAA